MPQLIVRPRLACWGDSLTAGITPYLAQALPQFRVENYGVGGNDSSQILTRFQANSDAPTLPTLLWAGSNNLSEGNPQQALSDIATMVAALGSSPYVILTPLNGDNGSSYYKGGSVYADLQTMLTGLKATYGSKVYDARAYLIANANRSIAQDVIDQGRDIIPSSLRVDTIHLTATAYTSLAAQIATVVLAQIPTTPSVLDQPWYPATVSGINAIGFGTTSPKARWHVDANSALGAFMLSNQAQSTVFFAAMGLAGSTSQIITGDNPGDLDILLNSTGGINFSVNNGGAIQWSLRNSGAVQFKTISTPAAPASGFALLYADVDSSNKTRLMARFPTGNPMPLATEL